MNHRALSLIPITAALFISCNPTTPPANPGPVPPTGEKAIKIAGKLLAPDGTTPIANALVYVPDSSIATIKAQALACGTPPNATWAATCTGPDGSFSFEAETQNSTFKVVFKKGSFEAESQVNAQNGQANVGNVKLNNDPTKGAPKMAVVTGSYDRIQNILAKLGYGQLANGELKLGTEQFDLFDGDDSLETSDPSVEALFTDGNDAGTQADIFNYDIVFFNCGTQELLTPQDAALLRQYVQGGGKIYASDLAYDYVEQAFPEHVDFFGSDGTAETVAEEIGMAEVGNEDIETQATVDGNLKAWLQTVTCRTGNCVSPDGTVHIEGFAGSWAVINQPHPAKKTEVKVWSSGNVNWTDNRGDEVVKGSGVKPLSVTFPFGNGKVLYTSYHSEPGTEAGLTPQERILQYLVFEL
ncbi:hypothetical protein [Deinococcus cellulosilyticus]|uniref:Uncharacterized protein n=1 Tax=Deinococcus cellulosilyticus (strain DSM 18568 / NBRC 106333 / KACC 11606 / 5516J-15) TaxID=1223518 RepID=A0A511N8S6_DEIC1|nr:hypothetical protein [Deinococcus cellulosilyticus]GEM49249.1 hypothetical protein DC3_48840 [Deinococcus cellulosilyticus NBRC 106333 = KACC 11606]